MVCENNVRLVELLHGVVEVLDVLRVTNVRSLVANLAEDLSKSGATHGLLAICKVDVHEHSLANLLGATEGRSPGAGEVVDSAESSDDKGNRRSNLLVVPLGLHGHGVLADRDADAELRAQLHTDSFDSLVQVCTLAGVAAGGHPVGGETDTAESTG